LWKAAKGSLWILGDTPTDGRNVVIAVLVVGTVFLGVVASGELSARLTRSPRVRPVARDDVVTTGDNVNASPHERIQHEVDNINTRLTWLLTFQGFLFAAVSLASKEVRSPLLETIPWIGVAASVLAFLGIVAAYVTIGDIRAENRSVALGTRIKSRKWLGRTNALGIPIMLVAAWIALYFEFN
jgi:hypothetical protein